MSCDHAGWWNGRGVVDRSTKSSQRGSPISSRSISVGACLCAKSRSATGILPTMTLSPRDHKNGCVSGRAIITEAVARIVASVRSEAARAPARKIRPRGARPILGS